VKKLDFVFFDAGGGHRSAADALRQVIQDQGRHWEVRLVNLQEILDPLDVFRKLTGVRMQDLYNLMLKKGWTLGSPQLTRGMHLVIRLYHRKQVHLLETFWPDRRPDLIVSLVPNFNRAIAASVRKSIPGTPVVTILTDIADYPPHFWLECPDPADVNFVIAGSPRAVEQAHACRISPERVFRSSGMILHPRFYETIPINRKGERRRLGLDPDLQTGLVLFGGEGSSVMLDIARRLQSTRSKLQLIFICGRNEKLRERLLELPSKIPIFVEGFTREVPYYMQLSDFFIGKPGPGSISEALSKKLPVIVERNAWTLPQERYNADWILQNQVGLVLPNFRGIADAVDRLLEPETYQRFCHHAAAVQNRAVFEIPDILESILTSSGNSSALQRSV
jgi:hypothetical protein